MPNANPAMQPAPSSKPGAFPTTHWSLVLHANADSASQAQIALETLCRLYWYPLYAYVRRQGRSHHEAEDCTQGFFSKLLAGDGVRRARPERGRFRTFLLTSLRNYLTNAWHHSQAEKRGGGCILLPLEFSEADEQFSREPVDPKLTPEQAFDHSWARGLIDGALQELRHDYEKSGRTLLFAALRPLVWDSVPPETLAKLAPQLEMSVHAATMALHRLRRRLSERVRAAVADTVADSTEVDAELRHLIASISNKTSGGL